MLKRNLRDLMPAFAGLLILFTTFGISTNPLAGVWQQKPHKLIKTDVLSRPEREPVIITGLKLGAREINLNAPFDDEDDEWIRNLSFKLKNHSKRNVIFIGVNLFIPAETNATIPGMVQQFRFGQPPNSPSSTDPILVKPGEAIDVSVTAPKYQSIKKFIDATHPLKKVDSVMVKVYLVLFDDGTKWDGGEFYVPDSSQPLGFRKVDAPAGIISKDPQR